MNPNSEYASTVVVVDDDASIRRSLERLLRADGHEVVLHEGSSSLFGGEEPPPGPTCCLLDLRLAGESGIDVQQRLASELPHVQVIMMTGHGDIPTAVEAIRQGAIDYLTKPCEDSELLGKVAEALERSTEALEKRGGEDRIRRRFDRLTPREKEVFALLAQGLLNKQIAFELGTSEKTIKVHRARVKQKLGIVTAIDLVRCADTLGIS